MVKRNDYVGKVYMHKDISDIVLHPWPATIWPHSVRGLSWTSDPMQHYKRMSIVEAKCSCVPTNERSIVTFCATKST